jgi:hypothetical protein
MRRVSRQYQYPASIHEKDDRGLAEFNQILIVFWNHIAYSSLSSCKMVYYCSEYEQSSAFGASFQGWILFSKIVWKFDWYKYE